MRRGGSGLAALLGLGAMAGCGDDGGGAGRLEIVMGPMDAVLAAPFPLIVRARDGVAVSVELAGGTGTLGGTVTAVATGGVAHFDLSYDRWETIAVTARAPGLAAVQSAPFPVRPVMRFVEAPPARARAAAGFGLAVELGDGLGRRVPSMAAQSVRLDASGGGALLVAGGSERSFSSGVARFDAVVPTAAGALTLVLKPTGGLADLMHGLTVDDGVRVETVWLPGGRVGLLYSGALPAGASSYAIVAGALPAGVALDGKTGALTGTPTVAGHVRFEVRAAGAGGSSTAHLADLSIFPAVEAPVSLDGLDADGLFRTFLLEETVDVPSRGKSEKLRILVPSTDGSTAAIGAFPLVVFHHGAAGIDAAHTTIFDRYDAILRRWATHGFVVASVDGADLILQGKSYVARTLANLTEMSENQRATIAHLRARNVAPGHPLAGRIDVDRILVSGHSRGGGASLITLRVEPAVMGAILLKPVDPLTAPGGETIWDVPLPAKPLLINIAGNDADLAYPTVDFLYERRSAPMSAHTIVGTVHTFSKAASSVCAPEGTATITRAEDWAITNAYAAAFLGYVTRGDLALAGPLFDRSGLSTGLSPKGVLTRGDGRIAPLVVDDFQDGDAGKNVLGGANIATGFASSVDEPSMATAIGKLPPSDSRTARLKTLYGVPKNLAFSNAHRLTWSAAGARYRTELPAVDADARGAFMLRARSDGAIVLGADVVITFRDAAGGVALISGDGHVGRNGVGDRYSEVIMPVADIRAAGADVTRLTAVEIELRAPSGTLLLDDLRFE